MKIELKNFKHAAFASQETLCFNATVYVDGKRMFEASNSGNGECNRVVPLKGCSSADLQRVSDWIASQPKIKIQGDKEIDDDIDFFISRLANREVMKKGIKRLLRKSVVICTADSGQDGLTGLKLKPKDLNDANRVRIKEVYPKCLIVNDLDIEQALDLYMATDEISSGKTVAEVYQEIWSQLH